MSPAWQIWLIKAYGAFQQTKHALASYKETILLKNTCHTSHPKQIK